MPAVRTDCHSPANFDPALYEYVGAFDSWRDYPAAAAVADEENRLIGLLSSEGFAGGNWETKNQCDHCGARIRYVAVFVHQNGEHIATGETCAVEAFGHIDRLSYEIDRLRKAAAAAREALAAREAAAAFLAGLEDGPAKVALSGDLSGFVGLDDYAVSTITDIRTKLFTWGNLSERQVEFVGRLIAQGVERAAREVERETETLVPAPLGRVELQGTVVSRKWKDSDYGGGYKITVKVTTPEGGTWLAWLSEPRAITTERGDVVRLVATLSPSDNAHFAFGKRPSKAEIVSHADGSAPVPCGDPVRHANWACGCPTEDALA